MTKFILQRIALVQMLVGISCQNCCGILYRNTALSRSLKMVPFKVQRVYVVVRPTRCRRWGLPKLNEFARWEKSCETLDDIQEALSFGAKAFVLDPISRTEDEVWNPVTPLDIEDLDYPPILSENLRQALQWLVGTSNSIGDSHRYVPQALWQVTEYCRGVVVLHADRDTDCIALYAKDSIDWSEKMSELSTVVAAEAFWISCPVPTMTLRWKRALYEACDGWEGECPEELRVLVPVQEQESTMTQKARWRRRSLSR